MASRHVGKFIVPENWLRAYVINICLAVMGKSCLFDSDICASVLPFKIKAIVNRFRYIPMNDSKLKSWDENATKTERYHWQFEERKFISTPGIQC